MAGSNNHSELTQGSRGYVTLLVYTVGCVVIIARLYTAAAIPVLKIHTIDKPNSISRVNVKRNIGI